MVGVGERHAELVRRGWPVVAVGVAVVGITLLAIIIPLLFLLVSLAVLAGLVAGVMSFFRHVFRVTEAKTDTEVKLIRYQSDTSIADIERHRERMNRNLDEM